MQTPRTAGRVPLTQSLFLVGIGLRNGVLEAMALTLLVTAEIHDEIWFPMLWSLGLGQGMAASPKHLPPTGAAQECPGDLGEGLAQPM